MSTKRFAVVAVVVALLIAGVLSWYASNSPDGLTQVAESHGFDRTETQHWATDGPLAGYQARGIGDERLADGLAGVIGVGATGLIMGGMVLVLRRRGTRSPVDGPDHDPKH